MLKEVLYLKISFITAQVFWDKVGRAGALFTLGFPMAPPFIGA